MPKRGGSRGRNWRGDDHFEHDDRGHENTRRVSFKPSGVNKNKKFNGKKWNEAAHLLDDDIDMMGSSLANRVNLRGGFRGRGGRLNSPGPRLNAHPPIRKFQMGNLPWYQIVIPYGAKHDKDMLLKTLLSYIEPLPAPFIPLCYKVNGTAAIFYVDNAKIAEKLFHTDKKISMGDGFRLMVRVRNSAPHVEIDDNLREKMKIVMGRKYNAATKALDLTKFHSDPELVDVFCALSRPMIMLTAVNIMVENIPDMEALNLSNNLMHSIDHLKILVVKFKKLKILYLSDNRIPFVGSLDCLKGLPLVELNLKGNSLVNKFEDHDVYVRVAEILSILLRAVLSYVSSEVRKRFPKLLILDDAELPPAIGFDVTDEVALPPRQPSFLVDPQGMDLVRQFLTQYYAIYDSESRQSLLDAYHEKALMSLCANYSYSSDRNSSNDRLQTYMENSRNRNLLRTTDRENRRQKLRSGKLQVVSFLSELPRTEHDLLGSSVDLMVYTPAMMVLTVNGVFRETSSPLTPKPIRSFHRTLIIVPQGGGFCIQNDILYVSNASADQVENAFKHPAPVSAPAPAPAAVEVAAPAALAAPDDAQKMQLVAALSQQTGMNQYWTTECLQGQGWDYQRAVAIFTQMHSEGKVPPEAFVK